MRILFHAPSRRGLGHVMRASTLIRAVQARDASAHCLLAVSHALPAGLLPSGVRSVVAGHGGQGADTDPDLSAVAGFGADLVVFDTCVPVFWQEFKQAAERPGGARLALILRELRPAALAGLRAHPILTELAALLIPHSREEFDPGLPGAVHVGQVSRLPARSSAGDRVDVLSTAGGGGHRELCEPFVATVLAADHELRRRGYSPRHLLITGPRYDGLLPDSGQVVVRRFAPDLPSLIAGARVVVSRAGYNTVAEILAAGTACVLIPGDPGLDDQRRRAHRLAAAGQVQTVEPGDAEGLVRALAARLDTTPHSHPDPPSAAQNGFTRGAALAAARLMAAAVTEASHVRV